MRCIAFFVIVLFSFYSFAQDSAVSDFQKFRQTMLNDYKGFRSRMMSEYTSFVRNAWKDLKSNAPIQKPKEEEVPPVVIPKDEKPQPIENNPVVIEEIVKPVVVDPQPQPVSPIKDVPVQNDEKSSFTFFGTIEEVRFTDDMKFSVRGVDENSVADALTILSNEKNDNLIHDCLAIREKRKLCDWAYLQMLKSMSDCFMGKGSNEATLLMAYIYMQSGYRMRLAHDGSRLYMLYASKYTIYEAEAFEMDGIYYYGVERLPNRLSICRASFPREKSMSLYLSNVPELSYAPTEPSIHQSTRNRDIEVMMKANKNTLDFYTSYPTSEVGGNFVSRWAMYANMPMPKEVVEQVYPTLKSHVSGVDQVTAVNRLLNWVQTGFVYEYDDKVWGHDRAFFPEESLYYPYCDCEDRSILLSRIIRDLLGLKCLLVYYPGHLASAVAITEGMPKGDYIEYQGRRYYIADGTIIGDGAPLGSTMPGMNNQSAKVILLE